MTQRQTNWRVLKATLVALGTAVLALADNSPSRAASDMDHTNYLTFSKAVALPGVVLPAGAYTFEIANPGSGAPVVRVSARETRRVLFAGFTHRINRPQNVPAGQLVSLGEAPAGGAPPIQAWYPNGSASGHQFIYR